MPARAPARTVRRRTTSRPKSNGVSTSNRESGVTGFAHDVNEYVIVKNGHLFIKDTQVRFWGAIGTFPGKSYAENEAVVDRLVGLGFNMVRYWVAPEEYVKGDLSHGDLSDHLLWRLKQRGIRVWFAGLNGVGEIDEKAVGLVDDPVSADAWVSGVREIKRRALRDNPARHWDKRIHRLCIDRMKAVADHVNHHTGMRMADDPLYAVWELSNEEWWFHHMKFGDFLRGDVPQFFLYELYGQWNDFLLAKYGSDDKLRAAWFGNLLPEESLSTKSVLLLPILGDVSNQQASSLGVGVSATGVKQAYPRSSFNGIRGSDVIEFLLKTWITSKQEEADAMKPFGRSLQQAPLVWDCGIGYDLQTQYMQQHSDAVSHDTYFNAMAQSDTNDKRFPWMSLLERPPRTGHDQPWVEQNRVEGKPFFVYETQVINPAKYRAEYPMEIARLGATQDWDIVCWHYWGYVLDADDKDQYRKPLDYCTKNHYPQGYHYQFDEVQQSAMTAAAAVFVTGLLKPAPSPTKYIFGRKSLMSWEMNSYGDIGRSFTPTTYRYGVRLHIDPTREDDAVEGPYFIDRCLDEPCPICPTEEISHDWQRGYLTFDAPGVAMFTGFLANHPDQSALKFRNGVSLADVKIHNPRGIAYPVTEDEKYIEFCVASTDGRSLDKTKRAVISLVSTSFNTGFKMDNTQRKFWPMNSWYIDTSRMEQGTTPVLVARVGARIGLPMLNGATYRMLDWNLRVIEEGIVKGKSLEISAKMPVFVVEVVR